MRTYRLRLAASLAISLAAVFSGVLAEGFPESSTPNLSGSTQAEYVNILLLGDSTVEGWASHLFEPDADQLEDVVRKLIDAEGDLPPVRVVNAGQSGEYVHGLLDGRYHEVKPEIEKAHYITIRYGLNDYGRRENFVENFPKDMVALAARIHNDNPKAQIVFETICVYFDPEKSREVIPLIEKAAREANLPVLDIYNGMTKEIEAGNVNLTYHRIKLESAPAKLLPLLPKPFNGKEIVVMDNHLDVHMRDVPGWFSDRHPNSAGYHIIGSLEAKYLIPRIRAEMSSASSK